MTLKSLIKLSVVTILFSGAVFLGLQVLVSLGQTFDRILDLVTRW